jgi:molybdopterin synthase sulfur carrier subunit
MRYKKREEKEEKMSVTIRFFAQFGELLGTDISAEPTSGGALADLIKEVASKNKEGYDAIFDENGAFREFVIIMKNGKRLDTAHAENARVADGDEIAVFPPVAGG